MYQLNRLAFFLLDCMFVLYSIYYICWNFSYIRTLLLSTYLYVTNVGQTFIIHNMITLLSRHNKNIQMFICMKHLIDNFTGIYIACSGRDVIMAPMVME